MCISYEFPILHARNAVLHLDVSHYQGRERHEVAWLYLLEATSMTFVIVHKLKLVPELEFFWLWVPRIWIKNFIVAVFVPSCRGFRLYWATLLFHITHDCYRKRIKMNTHLVTGRKHLHWFQGLRRKFVTGIIITLMLNLSDSGHLQEPTFIEGLKATENRTTRLLYKSRRFGFCSVSKPFYQFEWLNSERSTLSF